MEHVVFFTDNQGAPAYRRVADRVAALALLEKLVNDSGGKQSPQVHALTPVPVRVRTVFVAQVDDNAPPAPPAAPVAAPATPAAPASLVAPATAASASVTCSPEDSLESALAEAGLHDASLDEAALSLPELAAHDTVAAQADAGMVVVEDVGGSAAAVGEPAGEDEPWQAELDASAADADADLDSDTDERTLAGVAAGAPSGDAVAEVVPPQDMPHVRSFGFFSR